MASSSPSSSISASPSSTPSASPSPEAGETWSSIKYAFCTKLTSEFDKMMTQLERAEGTLDTQWDDLASKVNSETGSSAHWKINDFKRSAYSTATSIVPSTEAEFDELIDLVNSCVYTSSDSMLKNPITVAKSLIGSIKSNLYDALTALGDLIPTEFIAADAIKKLEDLLLDFNVSVTITALNKLLTCMTTVCNTNITSRAARLQNFINKYNLSSSGEIEPTNIIMELTGISEYRAEKVTKVFNAIKATISGVDTSVSSGVARLKRLVPQEDYDE